MTRFTLSIATLLVFAALIGGSIPVSSGAAATDTPIQFGPGAGGGYGK